MESLLLREKVFWSLNASCLFEIILFRWIWVNEKKDQFKHEVRFYFAHMSCSTRKPDDIMLREIERASVNEKIEKPEKPAKWMWLKEKRWRTKKSENMPECSKLITWEFRVDGSHFIRFARWPVVLFAFFRFFVFG